jgi:integrase
LAAGGPILTFFGALPVTEIASSTWDDFRAFVGAERAAAGKVAWSEGSFHQHKNAVKLVLKQAQLQKAIAQVPRFTDLMKHKKKLTQPRIYFDGDEYRALIKASQANIRFHKRKKTRWVADAEELHDYIIFMVNTGLRVGESRQLLMSGVKIVPQPNGEEICKLTIKDGKRGPGVAVSFTGAPRVFRRIMERRRITDPSACNEPLFLKHHRDAFRQLLVHAGLRHDGLGNKRDFVSLRHTYICFGLERGVPIQDIAKNTRTSVSMIEKHYAALLPPNAAALNKKHWKNLDSTDLLTQDLDPILRADNDGAPGPTRTGTLLPTRDFE